MARNVQALKRNEDLQVNKLAGTILADEAYPFDVI